jgi:hypothetical protein
VRYALALIGAAGALAALAVLPERAGAVVPCWQQVIHEWSVGRVSLHHPLSCYREALRRAPTDLRVYSSLEEDLDDAVHAVSVREGRAGGIRVLASAAKPSGSGNAVNALDDAAIAGGFVLVAAAGVVALRRLRRS